MSLLKNKCVSEEFKDRKRMESRKCGEGVGSSHKIARKQTTSNKLPVD